MSSYALLGNSYYPFFFTAASVYVNKTEEKLGQLFKVICHFPNLEPELVYLTRGTEIYYYDGINNVNDYSRYRGKHLSYFNTNVKKSIYINGVVLFGGFAPNLLVSSPLTRCLTILNALTIIPRCPDNKSLFDLIYFSFINQIFTNNIHHLNIYVGWPVILDHL